MCARMFWQWPCANNKLAWWAMIHFCSGICHFQSVYDGANREKQKKSDKKNWAKINNSEAQHITKCNSVYVRLVGNTVKRNFVFKIYSFIIDDLVGRESAPKAITIICHWVLVACVLLFLSLLLFVRNIGMCRWLSVAMVKASPLLRFVTHILVLSRSADSAHMGIRKYIRNQSAPNR